MGEAVIVILYDSREARPLHFEPDGILTHVERVKLDVGDYGVRYADNSTAPLFFERKSIPDLWGTMGKGYARFKKELERAKAGNIKLVLLIEGTMTEVYAGIPQSEMQGGSVMRKLFTLWAKYDLYPVFCATRGEMVEFIRETYEAIGRLKTH